MSASAPPVGVLQALSAQAQRRPQATALVWGDQRFSYSALMQHSCALAAALQAQGLRAGDRVLISLNDGAQAVFGLLGTLMIGAVASPLSPHAPAARLRDSLDDLQARALLIAQDDARLSTLDMDHTDGLRVMRLMPGAACQAGDTLASTANASDQPVPAARSESAWVPPSAEALALIIPTSGSRARPKGVMLSHANLAATVAMIQPFLALDERDTVLSALPLSHTYGLYQIFLALGQGATLMLEPGVSLAVPLLQRLQATGATVLPATPTLLALLLSVRDPGAFALPALRLVTSAADALPPARVAQWQATWPQARLLSMYGQTECGRASILPADALAQRPHSVGRGLPGSELWLVDDQGRRLPPGEAEGELVVSGPHVMQGYWRRPEETALALRPHPDQPGQRVLHTGDLFRRDAEGWLSFVARRDDLIKSGGERISPQALQAILLQAPGVADAAVLGQPDARLGQAVHAWLVARPGASADARAVMAHCRQQLEPAQCPRALHWCAELPRNETGKLDLPRLRAMAAAQSPPNPPNRPSAPG
ncbi:MAG: acyl--CoA ligase [Rubrivivax sp.]|nr:acyl--CoA ligase [Rubrivivax sp.]